MQRIPVDRARPEMVLAKAVTRPDQPDGPPIVTKGARLTDGLLERLAKLGVSHIIVEGRPVVVAGEPTVEQRLASLDRRFRSVEDDPLLQQLKQILRTRITSAS